MCFLLSLSVFPSSERIVHLVCIPALFGLCCLRHNPGQLFFLEKDVPWMGLEPTTLCTLGESERVLREFTSVSEKETMPV